jgi:hypothetical protein
LIDAFRAKIVCVLLFLVAALCAFSIYLFSIINTGYVNGIFYDYGLQTSLEWTESYWIYSSVLGIMLGSCIVTAFLSAGSVFAHLGSRTKRSLLAAGGFALWITFASSISIFIFYLINLQVNGDLYSYGLTFDFNWYISYSSISLYMWLFQSISVILSIFAGVGILSSARKPARLGSKLASLSLVVVGAALTVWALYLMIKGVNSYPASLAGLGLLIWGIILAYITRTDYVNSAVMEATDLSYLSTLSQIRHRLNLGKRAIYLPPKYLEKPSVNEVCFIKKSEKMPLNIEKVVQEGRVLQKEIFITAPGNKLSRLFEKTLGKSFSSSNLMFFIYNIQRLLVDELELAQNVEVEGFKNQVKVTLENSIYSNVYREATKYSATLNSIGVPLSSALACTLANLTGKPIIIKKHEISEDGKKVSIIYIILESAESE